MNINKFSVLVLDQLFVCGLEVLFYKRSELHRIDPSDSLNLNQFDTIQDLHSMDPLFHKQEILVA